MTHSPAPLLLIGAGGHARSVAQACAPRYEATAYADPTAATDPVLGGLVHAGDDEACRAGREWAEMEAVITAGTASDGSLTLRRKLIDAYGERPYATIVSPSAFVAPTATLGKGTAVMHTAVVNACTETGRHCVINTAAVIEHDCRLGENVFAGPGAIVCGGVTVGNDVFIGAGAVLRPGIRVCDRAVIGLGAAVCGDITEPGTYAGVPARLIKKS